MMKCEWWCDDIIKASFYTLREEIFAGRKFRKFQESLAKFAKINSFSTPENVDTRKLIPAKFFKIGDSRKSIPAKFFKN